MNVQVVNGTGDTATTNGLGNLIVGYNDSPLPNRSEDVDLRGHLAVPSQIAYRTRGSNPTS
jgi:hypothetical protein